jgi:hypothetical protein
VLPKRFSHLVPMMKASDYDYIIFDMPPVSEISITPRLARFMDMVLLVVESEKTSRDAAARVSASAGGIQDQRGSGAQQEPLLYAQAVGANVLNQFCRNPQRPGTPSMRKSTFPLIRSPQNDCGLAFPSGIPRPPQGEGWLFGHGRCDHFRPIASSLSRRFMT